MTEEKKETRASQAGGAGGTQLIGRTVGTYRVQELIGRGGMGFVYRARDAELDRDVALKILNPAYAEDPEFESRFVREARMVARLDHPNIVSVYAAGRSDAYLYIAMQLAHGQTIDQVLSERGLLTPDQALDVARQVAEALAPAHKLGIIHRDIKPTNIMVDESNQQAGGAGRVKLMDFGLARSFVRVGKFTASGIYLGTPEYSSPEQCETNDLDGRTDIYSLGVVLYEMLAGRVPYAAETPLALFRKITDEDPTPLRETNPNVPPAVAELVHTMMARRREDRFQTVDELLEAIRSVQTRGRISRNAPQTSGARRAIVATALIALVAVGAVIATLGWPSRTPPPPTPTKNSPHPAPVVLAKLKVAVFDFKNETARPEDAWMEYGLSDLLSKTISRVPYLDVLLRMDLEAQLKTLGLSGVPDEANREALLTAAAPDLWVTGNYYVVGEQVRVSIVAYRRGSTSRLFVQTFERPKDKFFALVTDAARELADRFRGEAAKEPAVSLKAKVTVDPNVPALLSCALAAQDFMPVAAEEADEVEKLTPEPPAAPVLGKETALRRKGLFCGREGNALNNYDLSRFYFNAQKQVCEDRAETVRQIADACKFEKADDVVMALEWLGDEKADKKDVTTLFVLQCPTCGKNVDLKTRTCGECKVQARWGLQRDALMKLRVAIPPKVDKP